VRRLVPCHQRAIRGSSTGEPTQRRTTFGNLRRARTGCHTIRNRCQATRRVPPLYIDHARQCSYNSRTRLCISVLPSRTWLLSLAGQLGASGTKHHRYVCRNRGAVDGRGAGGNTSNPRPENPIVI
jgi:hypothetical protein